MCWVYLCIHTQFTLNHQLHLCRNDYYKFTLHWHLLINFYFYFTLVSVNFSIYLVIFFFYFVRWRRIIFFVLSWELLELEIRVRLSIDKCTARAIVENDVDFSVLCNSLEFFVFFLLHQFFINWQGLSFVLLMMSVSWKYTKYILILLI